MANSIPPNVDEANTLLSQAVNSTFRRDATFRSLHQENPTLTTSLTASLNRFEGAPINETTLENMRAAVRSYADSLSVPGDYRNEVFANHVVDHINISASIPPIGRRLSITGRDLNREEIQHQADRISQDIGSRADRELRDRLEGMARAIEMGSMHQRRSGMTATEAMRNYDTGIRSLYYEAGRSNIRNSDLCEEVFPTPPRVQDKNVIREEVMKYLSEHLELKLEMVNDGQQIEAKATILLAGKEIASDSDFVEI